MNDRSRATNHAPEGRPTPADRRARDRRVLQVGIGLSLLLHIVVIGFVGGLLRGPREPGPPPPGPVVAVPPGGLRAVELAEISEDALVEPERPQPALESDPTEPAPAAVAREDSHGEPADSLSAADRLAVRVVDPRLWRPVVLVPRDPSLAEVQARIGAAVELLSDSALAEAERAVAATDWTVEDADGGKWGISPGKLHLGKLTLPLPIAFAVDPEAEAALGVYLELERQMNRADFLASFEDRVKAIRERRERERAGGRTTDNGGGA